MIRIYCVPPGFEVIASGRLDTPQISTKSSGDATDVLAGSSQIPVKFLTAPAIRNFLGSLGVPRTTVLLSGGVPPKAGNPDIQLMIVSFYSLCLIVPTRPVESRDCIQE